MAKVLITGASGLIGAFLLRELQSNDEVYAISRSARRLPGATQTIALDLGTTWSMDQLPRDVDTVVHLAQSEYFRDFPLRADDIFEVNTRSTVKLLDYARATGAKQFVLASSGGVYGVGAGSFSEERPMRTGGELGFYVGTRVCSELLANCYAGHFNVICLRFFFVYGPGQQAHMLIPRLAGSIRAGRPVTLRGEHGLRLNPIHVEDAAHAVRKAMTLQGSHTINVAGPTVLSLREVAETIGQVVRRPPVFEVTPQSTPQDLVGDTARMRHLLCEPRIPFAAGIAATLAEAGT